jgi:hypothetical protein
MEVFLLLMNLELALKLKFIQENFIFMTAINLLEIFINKKIYLNQLLY